MQGPRLYRFFNYEAMSVLPAPTLGWNPDANPWELADTQAPVLDNALIRPGRVVPRGALTNWADLTGLAIPTNPPLNVVGVHPVPGGSKIAIGRKTVSATAYVDPWFAPIIQPTTSAALATATAHLVIASGGTTFTNAATAIDRVPGPRGINFEGTRYYISYMSIASAVQDAGGSYFVQPTNLCTLNNAGTPTILSNAPTGFLDIKGYQSRIWGLGGIDNPGAGTTFSPLTLFFTNPIGPGGGNAASFADWKDPVAGTTNKIVMDGDTTDPGVGLAVVRNGLLIFRYASVWLLKGSTTANYTLVPVSRDTGCIDPRSIVETDEGVYYMSRQGLMLTNGVTVKNVSGAVLHTLQAAVEIFTGSVKSSFGGYCTCALASGGQIVVSIGLPSVTSGAPDGHIQPIWCAMFDPSANAWTRITSALFAADANIVQAGNNYPGWVFNTPDRRLLSIGDNYITQWEAEAATTTVTPFNVGHFASSAVNDAAIGTVAWASPALAEVLDGVVTTANTSFSAGTTNLLKTINYGFAIPSNATIVGIQAAVTKVDGIHSGSVTDARVSLYKAGTLQTTDRSSGTAWPASLSATTYGGSTDLWGGTWTPADINDAGFGIGIAAQTPTGGEPQVDAIRMTIYYTLSNSVQQQSFVKQPALYDTDPAGLFQPIPFLWRTKLLPVVGVTSMTRKKAQLKRWVADYVFQGTGLPSTNGFTVSLKDASGALIPDPSAQVVLPNTNNSTVASSISGGPPNASTSIQRKSTDIWAEVIDVCIEIAWLDAQQSAGPTASIAEIYTAGIEFQHTSELR